MKDRAALQPDHCEMLANLQIDKRLARKTQKHRQGIGARSSKL
jgi:hypothetical protein